jgi:hypothetical protein
MWTLAFGHHEDRTATHGYAATREALRDRGQEQGRSILRHSVSFCRRRAD